MTMMGLEDLEKALRERAARRPKPKKPKLELVQNPKYSDEQLMQRAFAYYDFNCGLPIQDTSHRAKLIREIQRITTWYSLQNVGSVLSRALDAADVSTPAHLDDDALEALTEQLRMVESNIQTGCSPPDAPPAT